jgi:ABC-type glycerol-3-phosphate transport system substrate-binding protein
MLKRKLLIVLTSVLLIIFLAGCNNSSAKDTPANTNESTDNAASDETTDTTDTTDSPEATESGDQVGETNWLTAEDISKMPETTIRYWYYESPERTELGKKQVEEFMKLHPNIKIKGSTAPPEVDNEKLLSFIKTHNNSNIHQSVNNEDLWYIDRNLLYPLDGLPGFQDVISRLDPAQNYTWKDGHVYSLSWYNDPMVLFYNKKLVVEAGLDPNNPPKTYDEFLLWAEKLSKDGKQWALAPSMGEEWWQWEFSTLPYYIAATGSSQVVSEDGKTAVFNTPQGLEPYKLFEQLFKKGYATKSTFETDPFLSGQVAITLQGPWNVSGIKRDAPEGFEYIVGPIPKPANSPAEGNPTYGFVRNFALINENVEGEEKDRIIRASWEFMKYLLSEEQMAADYAVSGDLPSAADFNTNPVYTSITDSYGEGMKQLVEVSKQVQISDMNTTKIVNVMDVLTKAYLQIAHGKMTAEEAIAWAEKEVNQLLAKE